MVLPIKTNMIYKKGWDLKCRKFHFMEVGVRYKQFPLLGHAINFSKLNHHHFSGILDSQSDPTASPFRYPDRPDPRISNLMLLIPMTRGNHD